MTHHGAAAGQGWKHRAERAEEALRDERRATDGLRQTNDALRVTLAEQQVELDRLGVEVQRLGRALTRAREVEAVSGRLVGALHDLGELLHQHEADGDAVERRAVP